MPEETNRAEGLSDLKPAIFALSAHGSQKYGEYPYVVHLGFVNHYINKYKHLLSTKKEMDIAVTSGWLHDTIEDCEGIDYEKIKSHCKKFVSIFSTDDPFILKSNWDESEKELGAKVVILENRGHFDDDDSDNKDLPEALEAILEISK